MLKGEERGSLNERINIPIIFSSKRCLLSILKLAITQGIARRKIDTIVGSKCLRENNSTQFPHKEEATTETLINTTNTKTILTKSTAAKEEAKVNCRA